MSFQREAFDIAKKDYLTNLNTPTQIKDFSKYTKYINKATEIISSEEDKYKTRSKQKKACIKVKYELEADDYSKLRKKISRQLLTKEQLKLSLATSPEPDPGSNEENQLYSNRLKILYKHKSNQTQTSYDQLTLIKYLMEFQKELLINQQKVKAAEMVLFASGRTLFVIGSYVFFHGVIVMNGPALLTWLLSQPLAGSPSGYGVITFFLQNTSMIPTGGLTDFQTLYEKMLKEFNTNKEKGKDITWNDYIGTIFENLDGSEKSKESEKSKPDDLDRNSLETFKQHIVTLLNLLENRNPATINLSGTNLEKTASLASYLSMNGTIGLNCLIIAIKTARRSFRYKNKTSLLVDYKESVMSSFMSKGITIGLKDGIETITPSYKTIGDMNVFGDNYYINAIGGILLGKGGARIGSIQFQAALSLQTHMVSKLNNVYVSVSGKEDELKDTLVNDVLDRKAKMENKIKKRVQMIDKGMSEESINAALNAEFEKDQKRSKSYVLSMFSRLNDLITKSPVQFAKYLIFAGFGFFAGNMIIYTVVTGILYTTDWYYSYVNIIKFLTNWIITSVSTLIPDYQLAKYRNKLYTLLAEEIKEIAVELKNSMKNMMSKVSEYRIIKRVLDTYVLRSIRDIFQIRLVEISTKIVGLFINVISSATLNSVLSTWVPFIRWDDITRFDYNSMLTYSFYINHIYTKILNEGLFNSETMAKIISFDKNQMLSGFLEFDAFYNQKIDTVKFTKDNIVGLNLKRMSEVTEFPEFPDLPDPGWDLMYYPKTLLWDYPLKVFKFAYTKPDDIGRIIHVSSDGSVLYDTNQTDQTDQTDLISSRVSYFSDLYINYLNMTDQKNIPSEHKDEFRAYLTKLRAGETNVKLVYVLNAYITDYDSYFKEIEDANNGFTDLLMKSIKRMKTEESPSKDDLLNLYKEVLIETIIKLGTNIKPSFKERIEKSTLNNFIKIFDKLLSTANNKEIFNNILNEKLKPPTNTDNNRLRSRVTSAINKTISEDIIQNALDSRYGYIKGDDVAIDLNVLFENLIQDRDPSKRTNICSSWEEIVKISLTNPDQYNVQLSNIKKFIAELTQVGKNAVVYVDDKLCNRTTKGWDKFLSETLDKDWEDELSMGFKVEKLSEIKDIEKYTVFSSSKELDVENRYQITSYDIDDIMDSVAKKHKNIEKINIFDIIGDTKYSDLMLEVPIFYNFFSSKGLIGTNRLINLDVFLDIDDHMRDYATKFINSNPDKDVVKWDMLYSTLKDNKVGTGLLEEYKTLIRYYNKDIVETRNENHMNLTKTISDMFSIDIYNYGTSDPGNFERFAEKYLGSKWNDIMKAGDSMNKGYKYYIMDKISSQSKLVGHINGDPIYKELSETGSNKSTVELYEENNDANFLYYSVDKEGNLHIISDLTVEGITLIKRKHGFQPQYNISFFAELLDFDPAILRHDKNGNIDEDYYAVCNEQPFLDMKPACYSYLKYKILSKAGGPNGVMNLINSYLYKQIQASIITRIAAKKKDIIVEAKKPPKDKDIVEKVTMIKINSETSVSKLYELLDDYPTLLTDILTNNKNDITVDDIAAADNQLLELITNINLMGYGERRRNLINLVLGTNTDSIKLDLQEPYKFRKGYQKLIDNSDSYWSNAWDRYYDVSQTDCDSMIKLFNNSVEGLLIKPPPKPKVEMLSYYSDLNDLNKELKEMYDYIGESNVITISSLNKRL